MGPVIQGGAEWQIYELLRRMNRDRFRPVLASIEFTSYKELLIGEGDRAIRQAYDSLDVPHHKITGYSRNDPRNAREVLRVIRDERIDLVHANLFAGELWGRVAAILAGAPIVTHKRGIPFKTRKPQNVLVDWLLNLRSDRIIVVSGSIQRNLQRLQLLSERRFSVVYPGIDAELWRRADQAEVAPLRRGLGLEGKQVVAAVGRIRPIKGQKYLIEAAPEILRQCPDARLLFVGHGVEEEALRNRACELGIEREALFLGSRSDVRELLSLTDVMVLPSLSEASPVALMEAAFLGVPAVATRVGGAPEILKDGVTGRLVPPRDSSAIEAAVVALLRDEEARTRMSAAATAWAHSRFDINRTVRQIEADYCRAGELPC